MTEVVSAGWSVDHVLDLPASRLVDYAVAALIVRADELENYLKVGIAVASAQGGSKDQIVDIQAQIDSWRGVDSLGMSSVELAGIAEIEREMSEAFPWYADKSRLDKVWREYGSIGPHANTDPGSRINNSSMFGLLGL